MSAAERAPSAPASAPASALASALASASAPSAPATIESRRLELSLSPQNGSLIQAPLSTVIVAATDALFADVDDMTNGEIEVTNAVASVAGENEAALEGAAGGDAAAAGIASTATAAAGSKPATPGPSARPGSSTYTGTGTAATRARMTSLNFEKRRHELASRIARHSRSVAQVAALSAAYGYNNPAATVGSAAASGAGAAGTGGAAGGTKSTRKQSKFPTRGELAQTIRLSDATLQHVRMTSTQADEAQDVLFLRHDALWKARRYCHDVCGALGVACGFFVEDDDDDDGDDKDGDEEEGQENNKKKRKRKQRRRRGRWVDFPTDATLHVDRYQSSTERSMSETEIVERLKGCVRRKLVLGEVGVLGCAASGGGGGGSSVKAKGMETGTTDEETTEPPLPWKVILEKDGGTVRLVHGEPNSFETDTGGNALYPMEARLTVLSESDQAEWVLLSINVAVSAKTGEWNHQLSMSRRQMFDLHRLCVRSMAVEEAQTNKLNSLEREEAKEAEEEGKKKKDESEGIREEDAAGAAPAAANKMEIDVSASSDTIRLNTPKEGLRRKDDGTVVSRPLSCLFDVAHNFASSLHLEVLSAQAQALQKRAWSGVSVSPVHFFDESSVGSGSRRRTRGTANDEDALGVVAIHFWSLDDRYGRPALGDLTLVASGGGGGDGDAADDGRGGAMAMDIVSVSSKSRSGSTMESHLFRPDGKATGRLTLSMRAVTGVGAVVSLSAGDEVVDAIAAETDRSSNSSDGSGSSVRRRHLQRIQSRILSATSSPFDLSASDALLAATTLCAERRCEAAVAALLKGHGTNPSLPSWLKLVVECGTVSVGAHISYAGVGDSTSAASGGRRFVELFRLECESKSGKFVLTFPHAASLLRLLSCNDPRASDLQALGSAAIANRRTATDKKHLKYASGEDLTGRVVREAFDGLARSMSLLGERVGVGGSWVDAEKTSASLRARAVEIACRDVRKSLASCAGMAATYGLAALALNVCAGAVASVDVAGPPIKLHPDAAKNLEVPQLLPIPPIGVVSNQQMMQKKEAGMSGREEKVITVLERDIFAITASIDDDALKLYCFDVTTQSPKPSTPPERTRCSHIPFDPVGATSIRCLPLEAANGPKASKRRKVDHDDVPDSDSQLDPIMDEVRRLAALLSNALFN